MYAVLNRIEYMQAKASFPSLNNFFVQFLKT